MRLCLILVSYQEMMTRAVQTGVDPADAGRGLDMLGAHFHTHLIPQPQGSQE